MESVLLNKPENVGLMDYFKSLDVFDKRKLIDELSDVKSTIDSSLKSSTPYLVFVLVASVLGILMNPTTMAIVYFGSLSAVFGFFFLKKLKSSLRFKFVIHHMTKNM